MKINFNGHSKEYADSLFFTSIFMGRKLSLKYFHVWGWKAEVKAYNPQLKKLDSRSISGFFIGYSSTGSRGSRF